MQRVRLMLTPGVTEMPRVMRTKALIQRWMGMGSLKWMRKLCKDMVHQTMGLDNVASKHRGQ